MNAVMYKGVKADKVVLRNKFLYSLFELDGVLVGEKKKVSLPHSVNRRSRSFSGRMTCRSIKRWRR